MIKVAYFFEHPTVSGAEASALELLKSLDPIEFDVICYAPPGGELAARLCQLNFSFRPYSPPKGEAARETLASRFRAQAEEFDLIHANTFELGRLSARISQKTGIPAVAHIRSFGTIGTELKDLLLCNVYLIAVSEAVKEDLVRQGFPASKVKVVYNGVSLPPQSPTHSIRRELNLPESCPIVTWAGQITVRKAPDLLLEVARLCLRVRRDIHFLVLGEPVGSKKENLRLWELLQKSAEEELLKKNFHLLGWRADCLEIIRQSTILLHTARQEPLSRVLIEALALGTPVVASPVGGNPEVIGEAGILTRRLAAQDFVKTVLELMNNPGLRKHLREKGKARWKELFQPENMTKKVSEIWRSAAGQLRRLSF